MSVKFKPGDRVRCLAIVPSHWRVVTGIIIGPSYWSSRDQSDVLLTVAPLDANGTVYKVGEIVNLLDEHLTLIESGIDRFAKIALES